MQALLTVEQERVRAIERQHASSSTPHAPHLRASLSKRSSIALLPPPSLPPSLPSSLPLGINAAAGDEAASESSSAGRLAQPLAKNVFSLECDLSSEERSDQLAAQVEREEQTEKVRGNAVQGQLLEEREELTATWGGERDEHAELAYEHAQLANVQEKLDRHALLSTQGSATQVYTSSTSVTSETSHPAASDGQGLARTSTPQASPQGGGKGPLALIARLQRLANVNRQRPLVYGLRVWKHRLDQRYYYRELCARILFGLKHRASVFVLSEWHAVTVCVCVRVYVCGPWCVCGCV
jgi:hypothetical protein